MRLSEAPAGAAPSRDVLLGCAARALLGARRATAAAPAAPQPRLSAASAAEGSKSMGFLKDIAAGTTGGIAVVLVGHPFDTLKVLLQTQPSDKPIYNGVIDAAKKTLAAEGVGGLYKGVAAPLTGQMFFRAALFFSVARTKEFFGAGPDNLLGYAAAGSAAWGVASLAESPIDFYKSQMQRQLIAARIDPNCKPKYSGMPDCVRQSVAANGVLRGPLQGFQATLLRNLPAAGVYFGTFEALKLKLPEMSGDPAPTMPQLFVAGGTAGFMYWVLFYPLDVLKSALQTDALVPSERKYRSLGHAASSLWAEGGVARFYKGVTPCLLRAVPANAVMLGVVTKVRALLGP